MENNQNSGIRKWIRDNFAAYLDCRYAERIYIRLYVLVAISAILTSPAIPSSISAGLLTAAAIFAIHETVRMRFAILLDMLSNLRPSLFSWIERESYAFTGGVVLLDVIVAVPMFSPKSYSWNYTIMIIFYIIMFVIYVKMFNVLLEFTFDTIDKVRNTANLLSEDLSQLSYDLDEHSAIPPQYSSRFEKIGNKVTPANLVLFDIFVLCICFIYLAVFHPQFIQFDPDIWAWR